MTDKFLYLHFMDENVTFDEYLATKLIDYERFKLTDVKHYEQLKEVFDVTHPDSFTAQKLFLINPIRRKFLRNPEIPKSDSVEKSKIKLRPKIKR